MKQKLFSILFSLLALPVFETNSAKIVGLVAARNEAHLLPQCFKALSLYTDAIIYLDNNSTDNSLQVVEDLKISCNIKCVLVNPQESNNQSQNNNLLLNAGRTLGGTHFILLKAAEMFTANCLDGDFLRTQIRALKAGDQLHLRSIYLWESAHKCRLNIAATNHKAVIFCPNKTSSYPSNLSNDTRVPSHLEGKHHYINSYRYGILDFEYINEDSLPIKQAWARCAERVCYPKRSSQQINARYATKHSPNIIIKPTSQQWFKNYSFFDATVYTQQSRWREQQVMEWFSTYGITHFLDLDIWEVKWPFKEYIDSHPDRKLYPSQWGQDLFIDHFVTRQQNDGIFVEFGAHNGIKFSNSYFLEKERNWTGLCIEPLPNIYPQLCKNRKAICIYGCVGKSNGQTEFIAVQGCAQRLSGMQHSYDPRHKVRLEERIQNQGGSYKVIKVPMYTLNSIIQKYNINHIDFLSVDTEGGEYDILAAFDFDACYVRAITVENNYNYTQIKKLLTLRGFQYITTIHNDEIYVNKKPAPPTY